MQIWIRNTAFFLQIFGFAICGMAHLPKFADCDCGMSPRICRFAIRRLTKKIACPPLRPVKAKQPGSKKK